MAMVLNRRYRLEQRLWSLDGIDVFLTFDAVLSRPVVARVPQLSLAGDFQVLERFRSRSRIASVLHHRNIVAIYEVGDDQGIPYLIEEHVAGTQLRAIIDDEGPLVVDDVSALVDQVAAGLHHAHKRGIVHGMIDPSRILVDAAGLAKLTEFGVQTGTPLESPTGGPPPMSVRLARFGAHDPAFATESIDLAALGSIAYEMLTGIPPGGFDSQYSGSTHDPQRQVIHPAEIDPRIPVQAGEVIMRSLGLPGYDSNLNVATFATTLRNWQYVDPEVFRPRTPPDTTESHASVQSRSTMDITWPSTGTRSAEPVPDLRNSVRVSRTKPRRGVAVLTLILAILIGASFFAAYNIETNSTGLEPVAIPNQLEFLERMVQAESR